MNAKNPLHVAAFLLFASVALWLTLAVAQGFFLTAVPQAPDYCKNWVPIPDDVDAPERLAGSSTRCVEFVNTLERLKYYHNLRMVKRNRLLLYAVMSLGFVASVGAFFALPRWRRTPYADATNVLGLTLLLGLLVAFSPMLVRIVLPPPSRWAPDALREYFDSRRAATLEQLTEVATAHDLQQHNKP
jgi:hypothetical protein